MNIIRKLSSKNFFVFNLVLLGVIFGFSLAFLTFSCTGASSKSKNTAQAQAAPVAVPADSLATAESIQGAFRAIAQRVVPQVVQLKTSSVRKQQIPSFNGIPWEYFFGPNGPQGNNDGGGGREFRAQGLGSGIIVRKNGNTYYALTNSHVVSDGGNAVDEITVELDGGKELPAKLVGRDTRRDLAMVSFETTDKLSLAVLGDSDSVSVGDWAIAVGNPMGYSFSVTMGIVSAVGRTGGPSDIINDYIQTDASINQGNSGGALVNIRGEVIGINMWIASNSGGGSVGIGFAIPINNAKRTIEEFINKGEISDGWLGVSLIDAEKDVEVLRELKLTGKHGALASDVFVGSPAEKGGIAPGDFITHVDGKPMANTTRLMQAVGDLRAGETHTFTVIRDSASRDIRVKIEARNNAVASENNKLFPGVYVHPITEDIRSSFKMSKDASGLVVVRIIEKSPAAIINLQRGDIVTAVNDVPVRDMAAFYKALRENAGKELWMSIIRGDAKLDTMKFKR
ncbi:MAG: trypsin-like peptidase domain-containing protein [Spirochaetaceae bacterium]|jgi:Do/DeqQ family serine protease|nr:trypsin-like peptidase domain-containing protein [Spirochaetaceae bacterium]